MFARIPKLSSCHLGTVRTPATKVVMMTHSGSGPDEATAEAAGAAGRAVGRVREGMVEVTAARECTAAVEQVVARECGRIFTMPIRNPKAETTIFRLRSDLSLAGILQV
mmetsp:Transcript_95104/g.254134  ORF Transcript_95104/g.254134 Transcript_95104/m.254134 type:complete len:109 (+) Transcript_95104:126-452(+)